MAVSAQVASAEAGVPASEEDGDGTTSPEQDPATPVTQPPYPPEALIARQQGEVIVKFTVRKDGSVDPASIGVDDGSGFAALDAAAVNEAANWRFRPARRDGQPVDSPHRFRVVFHLTPLPQIGALNLKTPAILRVHEDTISPSQDPQHPVTQPAYPADAAAAGVEGDVILRFMVEADGFIDPKSIAVEKSSGSASLDQAAVREAAVNWRFRPATRNGTPVAAAHSFRVVFDLDTSKETE